MRLLFAAGGTGGTVLPAITVALAVRAQNKDAKILFVGTSRGFETHLVPQAGFDLQLVKVGGLKKMGAFARLKNFLQLPRTFWQSWKILSSFSPTAVFGTGGYASGPILLAAALRCTFTAILEPNTVPGFTNRLLGRFVKKIFVAFEDACEALPKKKCVWSGLPMRSEILKVTPPTFEGSNRTILIFGGSQGAKKLNDCVISALDILKNSAQNISFIHQTGSQDEWRVRKAYEEKKIKAEVHPFIDDMAQAYRRADIILARSGSSVLEIAACGRPSILVPYPFSADDHQEVNARVLERIGGAICICEADLTPQKLAALFSDLVSNKDRLKEMSANVLKLRKDRATETIATHLMEAA